MNLNTDFIKKLRDSGLRPTKQRLKICKVLFDTEKTFHFTINDLVKIISEKLSEKIENTTNMVRFLEDNNINPKTINERLEELGEKPIKEPTRMSNILKRPKVSISDIKIDNKETKSALTNYMKEEILFEAETIIKYSGYINRQKEEIDKIKVYENMIIPEKFDYNDIKSLSNESREKFINIKPQTVGQAQRINGIRPSDISILLVYLKRPFHVKQMK